MNVEPTPAAAIEISSARTARLSGAWTATGLHAGFLRELDALQFASEGVVQLDGAGIASLDTAGAWVLQKLLSRLGQAGAQVAVQGLRPEFAGVRDFVLQQLSRPVPSVTAAPQPRSGAMGVLEHLGRSSMESVGKMLAMLGFVGETALALGRCVLRPSRIRWRPILHNIYSAGYQALPIVGLLSFLLGVVVAYQSADQLRQYGANIFIADIVGLSMLREFAPLIAAIIVAGRSGSAYAAQIGTMAVTEEIDAMRTLGIPPLDVLVLPKLIALVLALPLLTVFADVLGVLGGMVMANSQLDVGYAEFLDRFVKAVSVSSSMVGIAKAPVFAAIIAMVGCFQGFGTRGGADSVGRQTTRSVVQSIFWVIVADALFSVVFSALDI